MARPALAAHAVRRGSRHGYQTPFLNAMPDRGQCPEETDSHFFAEGAYVAVTGWPNMAQTLSGDGWLGIAPDDKKITLRSLDFLVFGRRINPRKLASGRPVGCLGTSWC